MKQIVSYERGFVGQLVRVLFWGFNAVMVVAITVFLAIAEPQNDMATVTMAVAIGLMLVLWFIGFVILGGMMMFTRRKVFVTLDE